MTGREVTVTLDVEDALLVVDAVRSAALSAPSALTAERHRWAWEALLAGVPADRHAEVGLTLDVDQ